MGTNDKTFRAHPGGYVTSLTRQGDLILATTTTPNATGYDLQGRPRWRTRLPDTVPFAPDWREGRVVMVDASGTVTALDGATGSILWQQELDAGPTAKAIWCGDHVVVPTSDGLTGIDAQSGKTAWSLDLQERPNSVACIAGHVVAAANPKLVVASDNIRDELIKISIKDKFYDGTEIIMPYNVIEFCDGTTIGSYEYLHTNLAGKLTIGQFQGGNLVAVYPEDAAQAEVIYPAAYE